MKLRLLLSALFLFYLASCGGGAEGTGGIVSSDRAQRILGIVDAKKSASDLVDEERTRICENLKAEAKDSSEPKLFCPLIASNFFESFIMDFIDDEQLANTDSGLQSQCERGISNCLLTTPSAEEVCQEATDRDQCIFDSLKVSSCKLEVGVIAQCVSDVVDIISNFAGNFSCEEATIDPKTGVFDQNSFEKLPATVKTKSCQRFFDECSESSISVTDCSITLLD